MSSNRKLWRIMAGDRGHQPFRKFFGLAVKIRSSLDYGHLEGRAAEIAGFIIALALKHTSVDLQSTSVWGPDSVELFAKKCKWPDAAEIVASAGRRIAIDEKEAELYLEVAKALMETSAKAELSLSFDWYQEKN